MISEKNILQTDFDGKEFLEREYLSKINLTPKKLFHGV